MWIFLLLLFTVPACSEDLSGFHIRAQSYDGEYDAFSTVTKVYVVVKDPLGNYTGRNPFSGVEGSDIPNSGYDKNSTSDFETGSRGPESVEFDLIPAVAGQYIVSVMGIANAKYSMSLVASNYDGVDIIDERFNNFITSGTTTFYTLQFDPTPGAPAPVVTKTVTFDTLRQDLAVAQKLSQIRDDKFISSLTRMVNLAEKLANKCGKHKKEVHCSPAVSVLNMVVKRLETANRKCDSKDPSACDDDKDWDDFGKEHRKDHDYDEFFRDWDRDDWHKDKKTCKRFVADEALKIIKDDANWLIKSLGGDKDNDRGGKADKKDNH